MMADMATVTEVWRYPVKSMQGERLDAADVTEAGIVGDRAWAVVDAETGKVASAKHPRKWARLLECRASWLDGAVQIELPDGAVVGTADMDTAEADKALSAFLGRDVVLASAGTPGGAYEMVWPGIEGLAPTEFIEQTAIGTEATGESVSDVTVGIAAPGSFFDVAPLHVVSTATLGLLGADVRRLRPNVVLDVEGDAFLENEWMGRTMAVGDSARLALGIPAMRCVMTTLPQPGLSRDLSVLQTIAQRNRVEIPGFGTWACAGAYSGVAAPGPMRVGDPATLAP